MEDYRFVKSLIKHLKFARKISLRYSLSSMIFKLHLEPLGYHSFDFITCLIPTKTYTCDNFLAFLECRDTFELFGLYV